MLQTLLLMGDSLISIWSDSTFELLATHRLPPHFGVKALAINTKSTIVSAIVNEAASPR